VCANIALVCDDSEIKNYSVKKSKMIEKESILEPLLEKAEYFGKTSLELFKLKAIDKASDIVSSLIPQSVVFVFAFIFVLFLNLGIAFLLGEFWGSVALGYLAVAAFYAVCGLLIQFLLHDKIKERIRNSVIKQLLK